VSEHLRKLLAQNGSLADAVSKLPERDHLPEYERKYYAGRLTTYTPEIAQRVLDAIRDGQLPAEIAQSKDMPSLKAIRDWATNVPAFGQAYARACADLPEAIVGRGFAEVWGDLAPQDVNKARLRWDAAKWTAGKLDPARWGDKTSVDVTVNDPDGAARQAAQRAELVAALQRLAVSAPMTIEGEPEPTK